MMGENEQEMVKKKPKNGTKMRSKRRKKVPSWKKIISQLGNKNFPVGKKYFANWPFPAFLLDFPRKSNL